jgi:uncharacterized protein (DUF488 family)
MKLFTIGHSSLNLEEFIGILEDNSIQWVADLRSVPHSAAFPHFNKRALVESLRLHHIRYLFIGDQLGGKPAGGENDDWTQGKLNNRLVSRLSDNEKWREGLKYLAQVVRQMTEKGEVGCLLCSEADPNNCHRSLVAFDLESIMPGVEVKHILTSGKTKDASFQKTLFQVRDGQNTYH